MVTSSPTRTPPVSSAAFHVNPKSFLLMTVLPLAGPLITSFSKLKAPSSPLIQPWWPYPLYLPFLLISALLSYA